MAMLGVTGEPLRDIPCRSPLGTFDIPIATSVGHNAFENRIDGTATRTGIVSARTYAGDLVAGDADFSKNSVATEMYVGFTGMMGEAGTSYADTSWRNLAMGNGGFASDGSVNRVESRFRSPNHEMVGGILGRASMVGGFHMIRDKQ